MVKRGDLVDANEFVVKVEIRLNLKGEDLADSNYFGTFSIRACSMAVIQNPLWLLQCTLALINLYKL